METVVLPAQDHLAQERYRYQNRAMSGMMYPLGGLPRTRRKLKAPPQVFAAASLHSETTRVSTNQNVPVADSRNGVVSAMDMTFGVLRGARFSPSNSSHSRLAALNAPQYRLHTATSNGFAPRESTSPSSLKQQNASSPFPSPVLNGPSSDPVQVMRTRSDGESVNVLKKVAEVEKTSERRKYSEKSFESSKNVFDRKMVDKMFERASEKPFDRRKSSDRKPVEQKKASFSKNQVEKSSGVLKKMGVITILQRPQTKEAAAENFAKITGFALDALQMSKSIAAPQNYPGSEAPTRKDVETVLAVVATGDVQDAELGSKDAECGSSQVVKSRPVSPKIGKKRSSREHSAKSGSRSFPGITHAESRVGRDHSKNPSPLQSDGEKEDRREGRKREVSPVSSNCGSDVSVVSVRSHGSRGILSVTPIKSSVLPGVLSSLHATKGSSSEGERSPRDERGGRLHGVVRSESFKEVPRRSESSVSDYFLPSSPPVPAAERWAGPAYSNSPPPSTLPFPKFPTQRTKSSLTDVAIAGVELLERQDSDLSMLSSAPSSPSRGSAVFFSGYRSQAVIIDTSSATKDLRRILNLDIEGSIGSMISEGVASSPQPKDKDTATQGLKRILQLG